MYILEESNPGLAYSMQLLGDCGMKDMMLTDGSRWERRFFVISIASRLALGSTQCPIRSLHGASCVEVKWLMGEVDHATVHIT